MKWIKTEWNAMDFIICIHFDYPFWQWSLILFFPLFHSNIWYDWIFERAEPIQQQLKQPQQQQHVTIGSIANGFTMLSSLLHTFPCVLIFRRCIYWSPAFAQHLIYWCVCLTTQYFFSIKKGKRKHKVDYEKERKKNSNHYTQSHIKSNRIDVWFGI